MYNKSLLIIITLVLSHNISQAQYDPKAFSILETMSNKYKKTPSFEAVLSYAMINKTESINEKLTGKITVQGNKFRLELDNQQIINNGKTMWTYTPDVSEVVIDHSDTEDISPSQFYSIYKKGYKYLYLTAKKVGDRLCDVIDLVPENKEAQFFKIRMYIVQRDKSIHSWTLFDKTGTQYRYTIKKFKSPIKASNALFTFNVKNHPDVEVIDLR